MVKCPECGLELSEFYRFCSRCGAIVASPIDVNDPSLDEPKRRIRQAIAQRTRTDRIVSPWWILVLVICYFVVYIVYFVVLISELSTTSPGDPDSFLDSLSASIVGLLGSAAIIQVGFCILAYLMLQRLNSHFFRERMLRTAILDLVRAASIPTKKFDIVAPEVYQMESANNVIEKERDSVLWTIAIGLTIVSSIISVAAFLATSDNTETGLGFAGFSLSLIIGAPFSLISFICTVYVLYFLSKDFYEHDGRWYNFSHTSRIALSKLGFPKGGSFRVSRLPERSMILYIILTILLGIFIYYWWYADLKDPNEHFRNQWEFEDHIWRTLNLP